MLGGAYRHPHGQEVLVSRFAAAVERIKGDVARAVPAALIRRAADALGLTTRDRVLTPEVTTHLAVRRALHGGPRSATCDTWPGCRSPRRRTARPSPGSRRCSPA